MRSDVEADHLAPHLEQSLQLARIIVPETADDGAADEMQGQRKKLGREAAGQAGLDKGVPLGFFHRQPRLPRQVENLGPDRGIG